MYRDGSTHLDEHDRAVGAIQIADSLVGACLRTAKLLNSAEHRWRAVREIHDDYTSLWLQLDTARHTLAARGANTIGFDELREHVAPVLTIRDHGLDPKPLEDARRAIDELRLAMPGTDWRAIENRTKGLVGTTFAPRGQRIAFVSVAAVFLLAVATWAASTIPKRRADPRVQARLEMKRDLAVVVEARKDRIENLALMIGGRCDRTNVQEYVKLLAMEGRWDEAYGYGSEYTARCGDDGEVQKWASISKKKLDRLVAK